MLPYVCHPMLPYVYYLMLPYVHYFMLYYEREKLLFVKSLLLRAIICQDDRTVEDRRSHVVSRISVNNRQPCSLRRDM